MSITDELRKWVKSLYTPNSGQVKDEALRIADRIDEAFKEMSDCWSLEYLQLNDMAFGFWERLEKVAEENAKLRELVRDLYECVSHANDQDWFYFERHKLGCGMCCTVNGEGCGLSVLADRLRELGVDA